MKTQLTTGSQVESGSLGLGTIISIEGSNAMVDFNGEVKKMMLAFLKAPKAPKVKHYMKEMVEIKDTVQSLALNLKGSREDRNSMLFFGDNIYGTIERMADAQGHFAGKIVEDARNGKYISEKQAYVVAYFAKNNGLI